MTLREHLFNLMKDQQMKQAAGQALTTAWASMPQSQKDALVALVITNPEDAGREIKKILVTAIETAVNSQLNILLAQTNIPVATLESILL